MILSTVKLNGNRKVSGILRGFDQFMNLVLEDTVEEISAQQRNNIGMVVSTPLFLLHWMSASHLLAVVVLTVAKC